MFACSATTFRDGRNVVATPCGMASDPFPIKRKSAERFQGNIPTPGRKERRGDIRRRPPSLLRLLHVSAGEDVMLGAVAANL